MPWTTVYRTDPVRAKADFMKVDDFPNVVGAIDGTLIPILGMSSDDEHVFHGKDSMSSICKKL